MTPSAGDEEGLRDASEQQSRERRSVDPGEQRHRAEHDTDDEGRRGQPSAVPTNSVKERTGRDLRQKDTERRGGDGDADLVITPASLPQEVGEKRRHHADDLRQEEVDGVQSEAADRRRLWSHRVDPLRRAPVASGTAVPVRVGLECANHEAPRGGDPFSLVSILPAPCGHGRLLHRARAPLARVCLAAQRAGGARHDVRPPAQDRHVLDEDGARSATTSSLRS
jgi:hypothetical protein